MQQVTSLAVVNLNAHGHPDYAFYREGVADRAVSAQGLGAACAALPALQVVCTGALALDARDATTYLPWLVAQRAAGHCVVVDANLRPSVMPDLAAYRSTVHAALAHAHIIKASDEDLDWAGASQLVQLRDSTPFKSVAAARTALGRSNVLDKSAHTVTTSYFEARGRLRLGDNILSQRSLIQRKDMTVTTLWQEQAGWGMPAIAQR